MPERNLNNGQPSLHAALIAAAAPQPKEHVEHVGAGKLNRSTSTGAPTRPKQSAQGKGATTSFTASAYWKFESRPLQRRVCELSAAEWLSRVGP